MPACQAKAGCFSRKRTGGLGEEGEEERWSERAMAMAREAGPKPIVRRVRGTDEGEGERREAWVRAVRGVLGGVVVGVVAVV